MGSFVHQRAVALAQPRHRPLMPHPSSRHVQSPSRHSDHSPGRARSRAGPAVPAWPGLSPLRARPGDRGEPDAIAGFHQLRCSWRNEGGPWTLAVSCRVSDACRSRAGFPPLAPPGGQGGRARLAGSGDGSYLRGHGFGLGRCCGARLSRLAAAKARARAAGRDGARFPWESAAFPGSPRRLARTSRRFPATLAATWCRSSPGSRRST